MASLDGAIIETSFGAPRNKLPDLPRKLCFECQEALTKTFHHCLTRQVTSFPSGRQVFEDALELAKHPSTLPPMFEPISIPKLDNDTVETAASETMQVVSYATNNSGQPQTSQPNPPQPQSSTTPVDTTTATSGTGAQNPAPYLSNKETELDSKIGGQLTKYQLSIYRHEIKRLRNQVQSLSTTAVHEHETNTSLRRALQKALDYALKASEWQEQESSQLKGLVSELQVELSALMAHLLVAEDEKRVMREQLKKGQKSVEDSEEQARVLDRQVDALKERLHQAFRDYVDANSTIERLENEVRNGSEVSRNRLNGLQRNLEKMSRDYDVLVETNSRAGIRIAELEAEMGAMVTQFNSLGDAKDRLQKDNSQLTNSLQKEKETTKNLTEQLQTTTEHRDRLEKELYDTNKTLERTQLNLQSRLDDTTKNLNQTRMDKDKLAINLSEANRKIQLLESDQAKMTNEKNNWETKHGNLIKESHAEIESLREVIRQMREQVAADRANAAKFSESNQKLVYQMTDMQNVADRQTRLIETCKAELSQIRKSFADSSAIFEDKISKLEASRLGLTNEKKYLTEQLRLTRSALKQKEDDYTVLQRDLESLKKKSEEETEQLKYELRSLTNTYTLFHQHTDGVFAEYETCKKTLSNCQTDLDEMTKLKNELSAELALRIQRIEDLNTSFTSVNQQLAQAQEELRGSDSRHHTATDCMVKEISDQRRTISQYEATISARDKTISDNNSRIAQLLEEQRKLVSARQELVQRLLGWVTAYEKLRHAYIHELELRQLVEGKFQALVEETRHHRELLDEIQIFQHSLSEEMHKEEYKVLQGWKVRKEQLTDLEAVLVSEFHRLSGFHQSIMKSLDLEK
jgi:chromosome segregation ATPase